MNILVIGGNGFIGSHLVDKLLVKGHTVRVFDIIYEKYRKPLRKVDYRVSSLENKEELAESLLGIELVFHLASSTVPSTSNLDPKSDIRNNLLTTVELLEIISRQKIKRFVYFSSGGAVYGNPIANPINEEHPLNPISSYGIIKAAVEKYIYLFNRTHDFHPLVLRPSNPFGPRQGHFLAQGFISTALRKIKLKESINIYGNGTSTKDYIYIDDLIEATYLLGMSKAVGSYNVGSGTCVSLNDLLEIMSNITGIVPQVNYLRKQDYDVDHFTLDITKATKYIRWEPITSLENGIKKLWDWINKNE
ncbi:MAG TPA: NAD-dependent epimerase/dehydratase family protein [Bacteroidales bacterium]|nr:NAD-dependent epimerase/dehydratase family protein [Bacteroidales bacterium]